MGAANTSQIVLGAAAMEITREPVASNTPELLPKSQITGVYPTKINSKSQFIGDDQKQNWLYRFDDMILITVELADGNNFLFDVQEVSNQPTWTADLAGQQQAVSDINDWLAV